MRLFLAALAVVAGQSAHSEPPSTSQTPGKAPIPLTASGKPDFHGLWLMEYLTPLERPEELRSLVIAKEDAADAIAKMLEDPCEVYDPEFDSYHSTTLLSVNGELRSSWIVLPADGKLPLTALARAAMNHERPEFDNPEERDVAERCLDSFAHPPIRAVDAVIPYLIVQTQDALVIASEDMNPVRIVDLAGRPHPSIIRTRAGDSNGRWDGDTLTIETNGFAAVDPVGLLFRDAAPLSEGSRVIERLRLISADEILYQFTIEDPALYTTPWLAELTLIRTSDVFLEYACHEGNRSMPSILLAARLGRQEQKDAPKE
jgi:hypothetical protein